MTQYKAPLRDLEFVRNELLNYPEHYQNNLYFQDVTPDVVKSVVLEGARFAERVVAPLNRVGDAEGCTWSEGGVVTTPTGFKEAYQQYVDAGWPTLSFPPEDGGQGLPDSLALVIGEFMGQANWAWNMYSGLSNGAKRTLAAHGTTDQKNIYLTKLVTGKWTGTMCLTESHSGSDLGLLRTKAVPQLDGTYKLSGTKIFISSGEHDMAENIVHIVLARLPDAPSGTKGISLFIVPKFIPGPVGEISHRNAVVCGSIEHKMGIHGNSTCVLNFDGATGYLIGPPNKGVNCMFTFMNSARIGTAMQGLAGAEIAFQNATRYARERLQMRSLSGIKSPEEPADPIIVHPDVRRMLLTMKSFSEGGRALMYFCAKQIDIAHHGDDETEREKADALLNLLTPIAKGFLTETGVECAYLGMQVFGGHGYIAEWGMEQNFRDTRISTMYEGTTGIQALDLLARKVLSTQGKALSAFTKTIQLFCEEHADTDSLKEFIAPLSQLNEEWGALTTKIGKNAMKNPDEIGAAATDYLMYAGYVTLAYFWAATAQVASGKLASSDLEKDFYSAKIKTARFYYQRILPRTRSLVLAMESGVDNLLAIPETDFLIGE